MGEGRLIGGLEIEQFAMPTYSFGVDRLATNLSVDLLVVMPIYNEQATIAQVVADWMPHLQNTGVAFAILALNDGSRDRTWEKLQELEKTYPGNLYIVDKLNSGHGLSCRLGYDIASASSASWVLQIDSDGQCDPMFFADFWQKRMDADCIFGLRKTRGDGILRTATSWFCSTASSLLTGTSLTDANVPYRLIRVSALKNALNFIPRHFNVQNVALAVILRRMDAVQWAYVPIHFRDRQGGANSINFFQVAKLGVEMLVQVVQLRRPR